MPWNKYKDNVCFHLISFYFAGYAAIPSNMQTSLMPWRITVNPTAEDFEGNDIIIAQVSRRSVSFVLQQITSLFQHQRRLIEQQQRQVLHKSTSNEPALSDKYAEELPSCSTSPDNNDVLSTTTLASRTPATTDIASTRETCSRSSTQV